MAEPFIGEIRLFPYTFAPKGWAFCDGQILQITENTPLFALLGITYGGNGRTTFGLPNLQERAAMSEGRGPGLNAYQLGQASGVAQVVLNENQLPSHTHAANAIRALGTSGEPNDSLMAGTDNTPALKPYVKNAGSEAKVAMSSSALASSGDSQGHENRQPYLVIPFCIALDGSFPSRS